jgi:hypothetical protein
LNGLPLGVRYSSHRRLAGLSKTLNFARAFTDQY